MPPKQSIGYRILLATIMPARESKRLNELNPFSMPCIQLVLAIDVRQSLVI